ncbi:Helix-turn-helix [Succinivibrio dextrinosolvens]|uniref:helix-turn-helix domain-containing protein n=1 Tax=Succinivibrio dextrinosolvens TaxID=83771 RepID=UPI0008F14FDF|nr:helix-turn-helix transcriptional regulator [Succinivibrio dextrinosolvens]SFS73345.1 Helix-turn-helix [Succinivibrio dextrinosolvens]
MSIKFDDFLAEQLKDPNLKKEYDVLEPEYTMIKSIILARKEKGLTQKELSELTGITQADLSKIENGNANPSIRTLKKLAAGLGKRLQVSLV